MWSWGRFLNITAGWQIDSWRQTTSSIHSERDVRWGDFSLSVAVQITVMAQGFKPSKHWQCLSVKSHSAICFYSKVPLSSPYTNHTVEPHQDLLHRQNFKADSTSCALKEKRFRTNLLIPCSKHSWAAITHNYNPRMQYKRQVLHTNMEEKVLNQKLASYHSANHQVWAQSNWSTKI